ncbi:MAG: ABC transporter ATP-binding protein, partial [Proteobacteria bacterium]|nr:ABC transporter ATP-binding protein [Pseudomonadota bacterium]
HDRDFIDRVAGTTIMLEGEGRAVAYAGGWSDMLNQRANAQPPKEASKAAKAKAAPAVAPSGKPAPPAKSSLSFTESHRLKALPGEIARLEAEIAKLLDLMADPDLFAREPVKFRKATEALDERQAKLAAAEEEWLMLEEKAESAG